MIKTFPSHLQNPIRQRLHRLYGERADFLMERLFMLLGRYGVSSTARPAPATRWSEQDAVLITYADMVQAEEQRPLTSLMHFARRRLRGAVNSIHILPFCPWSSDDGFSVIDYREVDPRYGKWSDVEALGNHFDLMFDLVLNHCSQQSSWFKDFISGIAPGSQYFITAEPDEDLSEVVRPRPWPLLTPVRTRDGEKHVWTTFSEDQVDLNWRNPDVLFEFLDIIFLYLSKGMRIMRLDAVAFLWKEPGTSCIHLAKTHEVIKLLREVTETVAPEAIVLTETNVPHQENISYFGEGDEAHMVYNFSLPPLLLHGLLSGEAQPMTRWARGLGEPPPGCTFFNFTASHDGIGLRPLQGILPEEQLHWTIAQIRERGGLISTRRLSSGQESPYELNITWFSALRHADEELWIERFICSQAAMLALRGIPGIYFHSLTGSENWTEGVHATGQNRSINRRKWPAEELEQYLDEPENRHARVFSRYLTLLRRRANRRAFHPDGPMETLDLDRELFAFVRTSPDGQERILCLFNFSSRHKRLAMDKLATHLDGAREVRNLIGNTATPLADKKHFNLAPYQALWLLPR